MFKKIAIILVLSLLRLIAQENFLKGVRAENLMLDRIELVPAEIAKEIEDRGPNYWFEYFPSYVYSPDSLLIAEKRTEKPEGRTIGIWLLDARKETEKRIVHGIAYDLKWAPSGKYLSFIRLEAEPGKLFHGRPIYNHERLCVYNTLIDETNSIVFMKGRAIQYSWSPTNDYLVYSYINDTTGQYELCVFNAEKNETIILDSFILCDLWNFSWSPDGKMIVYTKPLKMDIYIDEEVPLEAEIFVINSDGSGKTQITNTPESELFVKWFAGGKWLITEIVKNPAEGYMPEYRYYILKKERNKTQ